MDNTFTPWDNEVEIKSPDRLKTLQYKGFEVRMGAPTMGQLCLIIDDKNVIISDRTAASFIWSENSEYIAYSEWTKEFKQIIRIYNINKKIYTTIHHEMRVIQFHSFNNMIIEGIDSPIYNTTKFKINVNDYMNK